MMFTGRGAARYDTWALAICVSILANHHVSAQVVGCDVLDCPAAGCTLGKTTNTFIGTTSFNTSISPDGPLTWTVGASTDETTANLSDVTFTKNFYLGFPPSLDLARPSTPAFAGCALFFEGIARSIPLPGVTEYGSVTCSLTLQDACVNDLLAQATQQVQTLRSASSGSTASVCSALQSTLQANPPTSCQSAAQVSWGSIVAQEITGPNSTVADPVAQTNCHPSTGGPNYDLALIETQTVSSEDVSADIAPFVYSITPILSVFYNPSSSAGSSSDLPEAHLSCIKVVENSSLMQPTNGSTSLAGASSSLAKVMATMLLAVSFLLAVF